MTRAAGASVAEVLVALLLGLFLLHAGMTAVAQARIQHQRVVQRVEALAAVRLTGALLRLEASTGAPPVDWAVSEDELSVRAFRGTGRVCPFLDVPDAVVVSYSGYRRPDPTKDSVLLVYPRGERVVVGLRSVEALPDTVCGGAPLDDGVELGLAGPVRAGAVVARVFERGAYALSGKALRYRRGAGGRQPLTPELWEAATGWVVTGDRLEAALIHQVDAQPAPSGSRGRAVRRWRIPVAGPVP